MRKVRSLRRHKCRKFRLTPVKEIKEGKYFICNCLILKKLCKPFISFTYFFLILEFGLLTKTVPSAKITFRIFVLITAVPFFAICHIRS